MALIPRTEAKKPLVSFRWRLPDLFRGSLHHFFCNRRSALAVAAIMICHKEDLLIVNPFAFLEYLFVACLENNASSHPATESL